MSRRTPVRSLGRSTRTRVATADVRVRYCCPCCGGDHPRTECGLIAQTRTALHTLGPDELRGLRQQALEELAAAVRADAKRAHVERAAAARRGRRQARRLSAATVRATFLAPARVFAGRGSIVVA